MDVKIGESHSSSRSPSRSLSPKDLSSKAKQPVVKSYRNRNHSSSPEHKSSKHHRQSRSHSRDRKSSSKRRSVSRERSYKRSSHSPSRDSKYSRDKNRHSSHEKKLKKSSDERRRSYSQERKHRSDSRDRRYSPRRASPSRDKRRSSSRERRRSSSHDRRRSPAKDRRRSRSHSRERSRKGRSHSREKRHKERSRNSPTRHFRKRSSSPIKNSDAKKAKDSMLGKADNARNAGPDSEKPSSLPLNLTTSGVLHGQVTPQLVLQQTMAAVSAQAAGITGVPLPKYYNPTAVNPLKYAEQMQKRKLLWQGTKEKVEQPSSSIWDKTKFNEDQDGKMTAKFRKLMGIKGENSGEETAEVTVKNEELSQAQIKQEALFRDLDQQYEVARISTHTQRGVGLGYSAHPALIFPK